MAVLAVNEETFLYQFSRTCSSWFNIIVITIGSLVDLGLGEAQPLHFGAGWLPETTWRRNTIAFQNRKLYGITMPLTHVTPIKWAQNMRKVSYTDRSAAVFLFKRGTRRLRMRTSMSASMSRMQKAAIRPFFHTASLTEQKCVNGE